MNLSDLYNECFESDLDLEKIAEAEAEELETETESLEKIASDYVAAGRLMARGYADEMEKLAGAKESAINMLKAIAEKARSAGRFVSQNPKARYEKANMFRKLKSVPGVDKARLNKAMLKQVSPELALAGLGLAGSGTLAYKKSK